MFKRQQTIYIKGKFIKPLKFPSESENSYGVFESLISAMIFFFPNMLIFIPAIRESYFVFLVYNYIVIFILISAIANLKFNSKK